MSSVVINGIVGLEMLNKSYNPYKFNLDGWHTIL